MELIDSHAHIYLPEFETDLDEMIARAQKAGVSEIIMPAIGNSTHEAMIKVENERPYCKAMMGLHPCSVNQDYKEELSKVEEWLAKRSFVAIGEIGLDFYWDKTFTEQQYAAFQAQVEMALTRKLPIAIHSRNATDECIEVVKEHPGITGVFHCFSGTVVQAETLLQLGFYLGIGGVVTFKNSGLDKVIAQVGIEKVILETDAPYLAPVPYRGKRNECSYLVQVAEKIAGITGMDVKEVAAKTTENARRVFRLGE
jgi:TatD DNase family protein